jgi:hypothetical protein
LGDYQKDGKWVPPDKLDLKANFVHAVTIPVDSATKMPKDLTAKMTLIYTVRHITSGDETVEEKDDTVRELTIINEPVIAVLVPGLQVSPPSYALWDNESLGTPVSVDRPTSSRTAFLCFDSYEAANKLLAYIQRGNRVSPQMLGAATLGFSDKDGVFTPLKPADVDRLTVAWGCP